MTNCTLGSTNDIKKRFKEHNDKKVPATRNRTPFELLFYEAFISKSDAFAREQWFKTGLGRNHMKKMLIETLKSLGG